MIDQTIFDKVKINIPELTIDMLRAGQVIGNQFYAASLEGILYDSHDIEYMAYMSYIIEYRDRLFDNGLITEDEFGEDVRSLKQVKALTF
jgi:hypothetical protein